MKPNSSFIGRTAELEELRQLVDDHRLVTVVGPGGAGKTRLALEAAREHLCRMPDGVWLAEFAPVSDPSEPKHNDAAVANPEPLDEAPGQRSGFQGFTGGCTEG